MATIVLRVRLIGGDRLDVTFKGPENVEADRVIDHVLTTLAEESGMLRTEHDGRLVVLYSRGVAAVEVSPAGAVV